MEDLLERTLGEKIRLVLNSRPDLGRRSPTPISSRTRSLNLAINARDAMPQGGTLTIATANASVTSTCVGHAETIDAGDYVVRCVGDTGIGMPPDMLREVFEPFFTTKPIGQGTGLGLSMIYGFAKQSRGHVRVESAEGVGTTFRLYLPRYQGGVETRAVAPARDAATGAGETVLVVEDDSAVRLIISDVLRDLGYACLEASDGQAALPMLTSQHAARPADHRRRLARHERPADRRDRAPAPSGSEDPVRHRLRRACDGPRAIPRAGHGDGDQAVRARCARSQDPGDAAKIGCPIRFAARTACAGEWPGESRG